MQGGAEMSWTWRAGELGASIDAVRCGWWRWSLAAVPTDDVGLQSARIGVVGPGEERERRGWLGTGGAWRGPPVGRGATRSLLPSPHGGWRSTRLVRRISYCTVV